MDSVTHTLGGQPEGLLLGILGGGVLPCSPNPDPISDHKTSFLRGGGGSHIYMLYGLYKGVPPSPRDDKDFVLFTCTVNRQFSFSIQFSLFFSPLIQRKTGEKCDEETQRIRGTAEEAL